MRFTTLLSIVFCSYFSNAAQPWNHDLWLGRGGIWESRCQITVHNQTDAAYEGKNIYVKVGNGSNEIPLEGHDAAAIRVVNADNRQLLFNILPPDSSNTIKSGPIPKKSTLVLPLVCNAKASTSFTVYYNNKSAWPLADFLKAEKKEPLNGDFEMGKSMPTGWHPNRTGVQHKLSLSTEKPFKGKYCAKQVAVKGLAASWSGFYHSGIDVVPGTTYKVKVRIRAKDLKGSAGWYIHVGNHLNSQMINNNASITKSTDEWKELSLSFKAPEKATTLRTGSFIRGSGTAWFDDLQIISAESNISVPMLKITCAKPEQLKIRTQGEDPNWMDTPAGIERWNYRFPLYIMHSSTAEKGKSMLASIGIDSVTRGLPNPVFKLTVNGKEVETSRLSDNLLFKITGDPGVRQVCYLYVASSGKTEAEKEKFDSTLGSDIPSDQLAVSKSGEVDIESWKKLFNSNLNMVRNPDFEKGKTLPEEWSSSAKAKGVTLSKSEKGLFGKYCAETVISKDAHPSWYGWRQYIKVKPGASYIYGGWMETEDFAASAQLHAHINPKKGSGAKTAYLSAGTKISGTTGWTPMFSNVTIPHDHDRFSLHLTSSSSGTMRHDGFLLAECLPVSIGEPQTKPQKEDLILWQANPVVKVFKETIPGKQRDLAVHMALNESEPLQIALRSAKDLNNLQINVSSPILKSGTKVGRFFRRLFGSGNSSDASLKSITVGRVDYVPIDAKSCYSNHRTPEWEFKFPRQQNGSDGWAGWWPDPIVETTAFSLKANQSQPLWITFDTDAKTKPGAYCGTVQIMEKGRTILQKDYTVNVWDFEIPLRPEFPAIYDIRFKNLEFSNWENRSDAYDRVLEFMAKKKLSPDTASRHILLKLDNNGNVTCDFTEYDKDCKRYFDELQFKVSYMPHNFNIFGWAHPPRKFLGQQPYEGKYPFENADRSKLRPEYKRVYQQALKLYWEHLKKMGWEKYFVLYISDEPHFSHEHIAKQMQALCNMIHEVDPAIRIYSSTWRHCKDWDSSIDVWGVGHYGCFPVDEMRRQEKLGNEIWFTTDGQMCTDTPLLATERMLPHYAFKYDADAYEFWGVSWYTYNPWEYGWHSYIRQSSTPGEHYYVRYPDGDGFLIYPPVPVMGESKEPVTSIRIEAARDGVEDWCYLTKLKTLAQQKGDKKAQALIDQFLSFCEIPNAGGRYAGRNLSDPDRLMELRVEMGEMIERLNKEKF